MARLATYLLGPLPEAPCGKKYVLVITDHFTKWVGLLEIKKSRTSPRNPRCNGLAERFNRTPVQMIKSYLKGEKTDWDKNLHFITAAYRTTPQDSTGLTPNLLMLGRETRLPADLVLGKTTLEGILCNNGDYV